MQKRDVEWLADQAQAFGVVIDGEVRMREDVEIYLDDVRALAVEEWAPVFSKHRRYRDVKEGPQRKSLASLSDGLEPYWGKSESHRKRRLRLIKRQLTDPVEAYQETVEILRAGGSPELPYHFSSFNRLGSRERAQRQTKQDELGHVIRRRCRRCETYKQRRRYRDTGKPGAAGDRAGVQSNRGRSE